MAKPDFLQDVPEDILALLHTLAKRTEVPICWMDMPSTIDTKYIILAADPGEEGIEIGPFQGNPFAVLVQLGFVRSLGRNERNEGQLLLTEQARKRIAYERRGQLRKSWMKTSPLMKIAFITLLGAVVTAVTFLGNLTRIAEFLARIF
jgi:hypothetical protein